MASHDGKKTQVYILAGFLGAGKTTLLKRILSWGENTAGTVLIVNEFGDVGIDGMLLDGAGSGVIELPGGCVCCTLRTDLKRTLQSIQSQYQPERVFIEATGVADPAAISETVREKEFQALMEIGSVITVLEAEYWEERDNFGTFFHSQLKEADLILFNKVDEIEPEAVPRILGEIHEVVPDSRVIPTVFCNVDPESLPTPEPGEPPDRPDGRHLSHPDHHHGHQEDFGHPHEAESMGFVAFSFKTSDPVDETCFRRFTENLPWELFRMKGPVRFQDRTVMVNYAGGRSEWIEWRDQKETRLAFVGLRVNADDVIGRVRACVKGV
ncbi:MAG: GTP-binding protein [Deltaproteobacteria bacterium]|nr:GTP-binding protein [Deltaproteobacteria bacterium]